MEWLNLDKARCKQVSCSVYMCRDVNADSNVARFGDGLADIVLDVTQRGPSSCIYVWM